MEVRLLDLKAKYCNALLKAIGTLSNGREYNCGGKFYPDQSSAIAMMLYSYIYDSINQSTGARVNSQKLEDNAAFWAKEIAHCQIPYKYKGSSVLESLTYYRTKDESSIQNLERLIKWLHEGVSLKDSHSIESAKIVVSAITDISEVISECIYAYTQEMHCNQIEIKKLANILIKDNLYLDSSVPEEVKTGGELLTNGNCMRKVNTDNLFYGEVLVDRLVWVDIKTRGIKEDGNRNNDISAEYDHKVILQITNWRFIITILDGSISIHKVHWDFSWRELEKVTSSGNWLILSLKDKSTISIKKEDAHISSIKLWALGEAIKAEDRNRKKGGDQWTSHSSINFTCETNVPYNGKWSIILESYGIVCKKGEKPIRQEWNCELNVDIVNRAFTKKNLAEQSNDEGYCLRSKDSNKLTTDYKSNINDYSSTKPIKDIKENKLKTSDIESPGIVNNKPELTMNKPESRLDTYDSNTSNTTINSDTRWMKRRSPSQQKVLNEINALIGLDEVKERVIDIINFTSINEERRLQGLSTKIMSLHMVFTGNPGTGKTTIARMLGNVLKSLGLLSKGHFVEVGRAGLVGGYLGQTAIKTNTVLESALGGILFIDEAYSLSSGLEGDKFGQEAIGSIMAYMENHREDLVVIAAGYTEEMNNFISSNPGLKSRFNTFIHFSDYSPEEMKKIFLNMAYSDKYIVNGICDAVLDEIFSGLTAHSSKGFGNGREVRNIYEKTLLMQNRRLMKLDELDRNRLVEILPCDLPLHSRNQSNPDLILQHGKVQQTINSLIGISSVKQEIKKIINMARYSKLRSEMGISKMSPSLHMVFTGNPGTGKTTVARCLAKELYDLGILERNQIVEVSRSELVAGFLGQTAIKTRKVLDNALGGVLFIDEAYTLNQEYSGGSDSFGLEAIDTILKYMEDNKESLMVIVAGYQQQMNRFLESNPGLASRFNRYIHFEDYNDAELVEVFESMVATNQYVIDKGAYEVIVEALIKLRRIEGNNFSNARAVRNLFEKSIENQASRIVGINSPSRDEIRLLTADDIAQH